MIKQLTNNATELVFNLLLLSIMNCPQCHRSYSQLRPALTIPYCGDTFCRPCLKDMLESQGCIWCIHHPPVNIYNAKQNSNSQRCLQDYIQTKRQVQYSIQPANQNDQTFLLQSRAFFQKQSDYVAKYKHECNFQSSNILNSSITEEFSSLQEQLCRIQKSQINNIFTQKSVPKKIVNINDLVANQTIMNIALTFCKQHNEQKTLFCLKDGSNICSTCALFGAHKGHQVMLVSEVQKKQIQLRSKVNKISHYLSEDNPRGFTKTTISANAFLQSLKSNKISRKDEIGKWLGMSIAKITHKIEKQYHGALQMLRVQKQKLLQQMVCKVEQMANNLSAAPIQNQMIEKRVKQLRDSNNPYQFIFYDYKHNVVQQFARIKDILTQELKNKINSYDQIIQSFQIKTVCCLVGNLLDMNKSSKFIEPSLEHQQCSTQLYQLLNGLDQQQQLSIVSSSRKLIMPELTEKQIKKLNNKCKKRVSKDIKHTQEMFNSKSKESNNFTKDSIRQHSQKSQQKKRQPKPFKVNTQKQRDKYFGRIQTSKQDAKNRRRTQSSLVKFGNSLQKSAILTRNKRKQDSGEMLSSAKLSSVNKRVSSIFDDTIKFYKYPESAQVIIIPSIKRIEASEICLDNFKAIQILKKAISSKANIKQVNFEDNKLTEKILEFIADCPSLSKLKSVNLKGNRVKVRDAHRFIYKLNELGIKVQLQ